MKMTPEQKAESKIARSGFWPRLRELRNRATSEINTMVAEYHPEYEHLRSEQSALIANHHDTIGALSSPSDKTKKREELCARLNLIRVKIETIVWEVTQRRRLIEKSINEEFTDLDGVTSAVRWVNRRRLLGMPLPLTAVTAPPTLEKSASDLHKVYLKKRPTTVDLSDEDGGGSRNRTHDDAVLEAAALPLSYTPKNGRRRL